MVEGILISIVGIMGITAIGICLIKIFKIDKKF